MAIQVQSHVRITSWRHPTGQGSFSPPDLR